LLKIRGDVLGWNYLTQPFQIFIYPRAEAGGKFLKGWILSKFPFSSNMARGIMPRYNENNAIAENFD